MSRWRSILFLPMNPCKSFVLFLLHLQSIPLPAMHWNEVTRSAPISAKHDSIRYPTVPDAYSKVKDLMRHRFLEDNHKACPPDSKRNPGHSGSMIDHVIELGSMYHMLEPMDFNTWSVEEATTEAELLIKDGKLQYSRYHYYPVHMHKRIKKSVMSLSLSL